MTRTASVEIVRHGHDWIAHRPDEPDHDCTASELVDPPRRSPHGVADTETGAVRRLLRAEALVP